MKLATVLVLLMFLRFSLTNGATPTTKHYIVYMGEHSHPNSDSVISANHEMLAVVTGSVERAQQATIHHYSKSFRGFSAMLTTEQAQQLSESESVISVFESSTNHVHTTHSWDFLGVDSIKQYNELTVETKSDMIIGVIDTGVWPESESFSDKGLGPIPERFKGECITGDNFTLANCNRKIIGARFYYKGFEAEHGPLESSNLTFFRSARDSQGHGTFTASTVAGSVVTNVSLLGLARGTARGGVPSARLAIYKACWFSQCSTADVLRAFEDATNDGVDIISLSLGLPPPQPTDYFTNVFTLGSFHAFRKGVLVSAAAGNSGLPSTVTNLAPWMLTVAASSIDRELESNVQLRNLKILKGRSLNPLKMDSFHGVVNASTAAAPGVPPKNASFCKNNTLDHNKIKGKIVVCALETFSDDQSQKAIFVRQGGGVGVILIDPLGAYELGSQFVIPSTLIGQNESQELQAYLTTEKNPIAKILPTKTVLKTRPAPEMAVFSSMGPNIITPDILKPDITAPGVNILAAWSPLSTVPTAGRSVSYNIGSGTSASCPHVSAIAAIIKSCHPSWSPSTIQSAIMTTATVLDNTRKVITKGPLASPTTPFDYGSGHVNAIAALDPGLVYEFNSNNIIDFLCSYAANPAQFRNLTREAITCRHPSIPSYNFNYPSIGVSNMNGSLSVHRTVIYYGKGPTVYVPHLDSPGGVKVSVTPYELKFKETGEKKSYRIDFKPYKTSNGSFVFGSITWRNGVHRVRSPIGLNVVSL